MKLLYPRSKSTYLDIFFPLIDAKYSPILTHVVALIISTAASWHRKHNQYNWGCKLIATVVRSHETHCLKNYPENLETHFLSTRKGTHFRKKIWAGVFLRPSINLSNQWQIFLWRMFTCILLLLQCQFVAHWGNGNKYPSSWGGWCRGLRRQR